MQRVTSLGEANAEDQNEENLPLLEPISRKNYTENAQKEDEQTLPVEVTLDYDALNQLVREQKSIEDNYSLLKQMLCLERMKHAPRPLLVSAVLGSLGAVAYGMYRFSRLPDVEPAQTPPDYLINYGKYAIKGLQSTCGQLYPLTDICDFTNYTMTDSFICTETAKNLCSPQTLVKLYDTAIQGVGYSCRQLFPVVDYCDVHSILGYAHECFWKAKDMCQEFAGTSNLASVVGQYLNTTLAEAAYCSGIPPLTDVTCGQLLPLSDVCHFAEYLTTPAGHCGKIAADICNTYLPTLSNYTGRIPGTTYTCADKFPIKNMCEWKSILNGGYDCATKAASECLAKQNWREPGYYFGPKWWSDSRVGIVIGTIIGIIALAIVAALLYRYFSKIKPKHTIAELPDPQKNTLLKEAADVKIDINNDTLISTAVEKFADSKNESNRAKRILNSIRFSFLAAEKADPNKNPKAAPLQNLLEHDTARDITRQIFLHAGLDTAKRNDEEPGCFSRLCR